MQLFSNILNPEKTSLFSEELQSNANLQTVTRLTLTLNNQLLISRMHISDINNEMVDYQQYVG